MSNWDKDLGKEEARIRLIYKLLYGFITEDIRALKIPGDIRTTMKRELEIKGWFRNGYLPLETWSVLERHKLGWAWESDKVTVWFVRIETNEAIAIPLEHIRSWLQDTKQNDMERLECKCGAEFIVPAHYHPAIIRQDIQWSNHGTDHKYHSACLFIEPSAFEAVAKLSTVEYKQLALRINQ